MLTANQVLARQQLFATYKTLPNWILGSSVSSDFKTKLRSMTSGIAMMEMSLARYESIGEIDRANYSRKMIRRILKEVKDMWEDNDPERNISFQAELLAWEIIQQIKVSLSVFHNGKLDEKQIDFIELKIAQLSRLYWDI